MSENIQLPPTFTIAFPIAEQQQGILQATMQGVAHEANDYLYQEHSEHYDVRARRAMSLVLLGAGAVEPRRTALADAGFKIRELEGAIREIRKRHGEQTIPVPIRRVDWWPRRRGDEQGNLFGVELVMDSEAAQHLSQQRAELIGVLGSMGAAFLPVQLPENVLLVDVPARVNLEPKDREAIEDIGFHHLAEAGIAELQFAPLAIRVLTRSAARSRERRTS